MVVADPTSQSHHISTRLHSELPVMGPSTSSEPHENTPTPPSDQPTTAPSSTSDSTSTVPTLPNEIWKLVTSHLDNATLKNARLVNSAFKDFSTPRLYRHVCLSVTRENLQNLLRLSKNEELSQHVQVLYLDLTTYLPNISPEQYAQWMEQEFYSYTGFHTRSTGNTGPLSAAKLLKVLETNPASKLGDSYLSGAPKAAFVAGYAQATARTHFFLEKVKKDRIYGVSKELFASFKNIHTVSSICAWDFAEDFYDQFKGYLCSHLPEKTLQQIPGLEAALPVSEKVKPTGGS